MTPTQKTAYIQKLSDILHAKFFFDIETGELLAENLLIEEAENRLRDGLDFVEISQWDTKSGNTECVYIL